MIAAGHAVAENANAIITTLIKNLFYMKEDYEIQFINFKIQKFK